MTRWHDPDRAGSETAVCRCFHCTEARYHAELAVQAEAELAAEALARAEAELAGRQLRFPFPVPHAAHLPRSL